MKATILYLTSSPHDHPAAGGRTRIVSEIKYGIAGRYDVVVLCMVPPSKLRNRQLLRARKSLQEITRSRVIYWPALPSFGIPWLRRASQLLQAKCVASVASKVDARGIHAHGLSSAHVAEMTRHKGFNGWVLFDVHGAGPEEYLHAAARVDKKWLIGLEADEKAALQRADCVVFVSGRMREHYARKYGVVSRNSAVVPCATDAHVTLDPSLRSELRRKLGVENRLVFVYSGSWRKYQMGQETGALFAQIRKRTANAFFLILTGHPDKFQSSVDAQRLAPADYAILSLPHEEVFRVLQAADIGFLLRDASIVNQVASPTKFAEYCICGVPVLLTRCVGDYSEEAERERLGHVVDSLEVNTTLCKFLGDVQNRRDAYAARCHAYARDHLTWQEAGRTLQDAYACLLREGRFVQPAVVSCD